MAEFFTRRDRLAIATELCSTAEAGNPNHPLLHKDIERAAFVALASPTFRATITALVARQVHDGLASVPPATSQED